MWLLLSRSRFPNGFYVEVKYDGERMMCHLLKDQTVKFFSRNGKDPPSHKTTGIADALRRAFPSHNEIIVDGEAVLRDKAGLVLPFGEQGVHKQKAHSDVTCCLIVFDLIALDGKDLMSLPLKKRRKILEDTLVEQTQPYRVTLSHTRLMKTAKELADAFTESVQKNLEGLMIKDPNAKYVAPANRTPSPPPTCPHVIPPHLSSSPTFSAGTPPQTESTGTR